MNLDSVKLVTSKITVPELEEDKLTITCKETIQMEDKRNSFFLSLSEFTIITTSTMINFSISNPSTQQNVILTSIPLVSFCTFF